MKTGRPAKYPRTAFGERIHAARESLGLSQTEVAQQLGITQMAYAFWERRPVALRPEQIKKLSEILNVPVNYLFGQETKKSHTNGPTGKVHRIFEEVSRLPRHQQSKVVEFVEAFVRQKTANQ